MARNRRRARGRRPTEGSPANANGAAPNGADPLDDDVERHVNRVEEPNDPLEHAAPDVELAEAQMALGRPELAEVPDEADLEAFEEEQSGHQLATRASGQRAGAEVQKHERRPLPARFIGFLQGCWHELQRVQWPDRRQVIQATGVVLGFVIVAGIFLGVADLVSSKIVNLILK